MEIFRISREKYANTLSSSGKANRWNIDGQKVIYGGTSRSLSTLELVVHRSYIQPTATYKMMVISIADNDKLFETVKISDLPSNWRSRDAYGKLQRIGASWYQSQKTLILRVPSAVIPEEYNVVINCDHEDFTKNVKLVRTEDYFWDPRLF